MSDKEEVTDLTKQEPVSVSKSINLEDKTDDSGMKFGTYILVGIIIICLIVLAYYSWCQFIDNSEQTIDVKKECGSSDKSVIDFNLRDAINSLNSKQNKLLQNLTGDVGI